VINKRIERKTSRTAEMTCLSRAASSLEKVDHYHGDDYLAVCLLPSFIRVLIHTSLCRKFFVRFLAPKGVYEYVIARTKYVDAAFRRALTERFDQILLFGAGFPLMQHVISRIFLQRFAAQSHRFAAGPGLANIKEIKRLRGDDLVVAAQANVQIDAEIGQKGHFRMESNEIKQMPLIGLLE